MLEVPDARRGWHRARLDPLTLHEGAPRVREPHDCCGRQRESAIRLRGQVRDRYVRPLRALMPGNESEAAALLDAYLERANGQARLAALAD